MAAPPHSTPVQNYYQPVVYVAIPPPQPPKGKVTTTVMILIVVVAIVAVLVIVPFARYLLVSSSFQPGPGPRSLGVAITRDSTGDYNLKIIQSLPGLAVSDTRLTATRAGGVLVPRILFGALECIGEGAFFTKMGASPSIVEAGDFIQLVGAGNLCAGGAVAGNQFTVGDVLEISDSAGVLWSGYLDIGGPPRTIGVNIARDANGNYTMKIVQSLSGLTISGTRLAALRGSTVLISEAPFDALDCAGEGAIYVKVGANVAKVEAGDFVHLIGTVNSCAGGGAAGNQFAVGDAFEISDSAGVLWSGKIN